MFTLALHSMYKLAAGMDREAAILDIPSDHVTSTFSPQGGGEGIPYTNDGGA